MGVESIGGGVEAVGGMVFELEREKVEEGACGCCVRSVNCAMKSEREGKIEAFQKPLENASAITFMSPLKCSMVQSNCLCIYCHLTCFPKRLYRLEKACGGLSSVSIVNLHPVSTDLKCYNDSTTAKTSLSKVK